MSRIKKQAATSSRVVATVPTFRSGWVSFLKPISIWLLALGLVYGLVFLRDLPARANQIDFSHYYVSALAMRQGIDPYTTDLKPLASSLRLDIAEMNHGTYPPTFILCFEPLTLLSPLSAYWLWIALNVGFFATVLYLLLDGLPGDTELRLALAGLAIFYTPITDNFFYAQTQILILLLLVLFVRWLRSGRHVLAGFVLAFAGLLKVFPLILIGYLVLRRQSKALVYTGLGLILGGVVTFAFVGIRRSLHFLEVLPFLTSPNWLARFTNLNLSAMVSHLLWFGSTDPRLEVARRVTVVIAELAILALTARATLRSPKLSDDSDDHVIALWIVTATLLSPTVWMHYLVLLLIPFAVLVRQRLRGDASRRAAWLGVGSYVIAELLMAIYLGFGQLADWTQRLPVWTPIPSMIGWSLSLLLAYAAAYFLAVDTIPPPAPASGQASRRQARCRA